MERYEEKKRERRRRDFCRMVKRAVARMQLRYRRPGDLGPRGVCRTWDEIFRARHRDGRRSAENPKLCSCHWLGCGNTRATWGDRTLREYRQALAATEQLIETSLRDDDPGRRRLKRRGLWP